MAFFLRDNALDDLNARPKGKSMRYQPTDSSHIFDQRAVAKENASKAMQSYENPLHAPVYDPMMAYGAKNSSGNNSPSKGHYDDDYQNHQQHYPQQQPAAGRSRTSISMGNGMHMREERPMMASKKMVHGGDDVIRRGNGNILAPKPLPWEESRPKIRGHQQLPDAYLQQIANKDEAVRDEQIRNMARCGQENFYKGFSNKPDKPVGTHKVEQSPLNSKGIGIWGFGGMGRMSEESTGGLRKKQHHLAPIESQAARENRIAASNQSHEHYNQNASYGSASSGGGLSPKSSPHQHQQQYDNRPWARPTDLQQQKLQNGFADDNIRQSVQQQQQHQMYHNGGSGYSNSTSPHRARAASMMPRDKNSSVINDCLNFAHDKTSTDPSLRQRQTRYPDPSTVPITDPMLSNKGAGAGGPNANYLARYEGAIQRQHTDVQRGNTLASPPGARFASRADTTNGASFLAPRSQTSFN